MMWKVTKIKSEVGEVGPDRRKNKNCADNGDHIFAERWGSIVKIHRAHSQAEAVALRDRVLAGEVKW